MTIAPREAAQALGINGVVVSVERDGSDGGGTPLHLALSYRQFQDAFGGDWATRLGLVQLPACALTTPTVPACRRETPVGFRNDTAKRTLETDLLLPDGGARSGDPRPPGTSVSSATLRTGTANPEAEAGPVGTVRAGIASSTTVLAATTTATTGPGGGGDVTATSLRAAGSWQAGGAADSFTWSNPIPAPAVPGNLVPKLQLSYDSQSVDGLTSSTNNQASQVGDGWQLPQSFVERSYASCHDNPAGPTRTGDNCWSAGNTLTLSLNGSSTKLIKDDATGTYRAQGDSNEKIEYLAGAANGAQNGEHFKVTTNDGTQYWFGLNQLPGWTSGSATTDSVWTEPVYATTAGQPCYHAVFADSWCQQAYRWNLDYVVDTHADTIAYFYKTEQGHYAADDAATATAQYTRGGYLSKIQYGQRAGQVYSTQPAAQVVFTVNGRCNTSATGCDVSGLNASSASDWPDVPYDMDCAAGAACLVHAPSFWTAYMVTGIRTQVLVGTTETDADSWALAYSFPPTGDSTQPSLWLDSITHTGQDTGAGGSSVPLSLPRVAFTGRPLSNRVDVTDGYSPITRQRLTGVTTETGARVTVTYSAPDCATAVPSDPAQNTRLCYPSYWTPNGQTSPVLDWFNKFVVTSVTQQDPTGGSANDTVTTSYTPVGTPAWHHDDNPLLPAGQRTWNEWRGYQGMVVSTGTAPDPVTRTQYGYFRGMDGDTLPNNGVRRATVTDSRGDPAITDLDQYSGQVYETRVFNGPALVTDTISTPWSSAATATHALGGGLPDQHAFLTGTATTRVYTPLASGSTRQTRTDYTHDSHGRIATTDDQGDVSTAADDLCTTVKFADNTTTWILDKTAETRIVSLGCSATPNLPADLVSDTLTFYDSSAVLAAAPSAGDATKRQEVSSYSGSTPVCTTTQSRAVDQYGRPTDVYDGLNHRTHTDYVPAVGAVPTSIAVTDPLNHVSTVVLDPLRGLVLRATDAAGYVTSSQYDALGRVTAVYRPGEVAPNPPSLKFSYVVSDSGPSVVDTYTLEDDSTFRLSETLYDSLLRARETQAQTVDGGRTITDTVYNTDGWKSGITDPYYNASPVSTTYVQAQIGDVPSATGYAYDGAGRQTDAISYARGTETWRTTTGYGGDFTTVVPPAGRTATTQVVDARGRRTDLIQYRAGRPADYVNDQPADYTDTRYTSTPAGKPATQVDPAGNTWSWTYDLLGQRTDSYDPDAGHVRTGYDNAGRPVTSTDARGRQTTTTYDDDGRRTGLYDTTATQALSSANQLAGWTYDTLKKGYPTSSTSYSNGDTYTNAVLGYNSLGKAQATRTTLTGEGTNLIPATGFTTTYGYTLTGRLKTRNDPAEGGLPAETLTYGYDTFGDPTSLKSSGGATWDYVTSVGYDEYGQPLIYTMGPSTSQVQTALTYDVQTHGLTDIQTTASAVPGVVDDLSYSFANASVSKGAGLLVSTVDKQNNSSTVDTQCFQYDYADRVQQAWTATDGCAAIPVPGNSPTVGGPLAPYWQSWTYDPAGNRTTQTDHGATGVPDTTTTYTYPAAGSATDQPHTLTGTTATGPGAAASTASYSYDPAGNTLSINSGALGNQTLTWDTQGRLATDTTGAGTAGYVYDTDGKMSVRRDPGTTTLYVDDAQIVLSTASQSVSGTRYYTLGDSTVAERTSAGAVHYLVPDRQSTDQLAVSASTLSAVRRQYLPFGQVRGTAGTWVGGDKGFVSGHDDVVTGLETLGVRQYDPAVGRFLSPDPMFEDNDPSQTNGYDYAGNDPVTGADPDGNYRVAPVDGGSDAFLPSGSNGEVPCDESAACKQWRDAPTAENKPKVGKPNKLSAAAAASILTTGLNILNDYYSSKEKGYVYQDVTSIISKMTVQYSDGEAERVVVITSKKGLPASVIKSLNEAGIWVFKASPKEGSLGKGHAEGAAKALREDVDLQEETLGGKITDVDTALVSANICSPECEEDATAFVGRPGTVLEKGTRGIINGQRMDNTLMASLRKALGSGRPFAVWLRASMLGTGPFGGGGGGEEDEEGGGGIMSNGAVEDEE
ncbi:RHS repeat-associated core domain-containing protein [Kitasatospora sp. NPDC088783]|uniref:RHS repeat domain-containing protein n=1 Tax=Kitasatospora sp. NPDC088783 TaxID=3364077 RepID=UPI003813CBD5